MEARPGYLPDRQHHLDDLDVDAWGPGAGELVENIPAELGAQDRPEEFRPAHPRSRTSLTSGCGPRRRSGTARSATSTSAG
jgi:hypothetical protein